MTNKDKIRVYWDSCIFIQYITGGESDSKLNASEAEKSIKRYADSKLIIDEAIAGNYEIVTSAFTIAEVFKDKKEKPIRYELEKFFNNQYILIMNVSQKIAIDAGNIQLDKNIPKIKPPDAIHIATAILSKAKEFHTTDKKLLSIGKLKYKEFLKFMKPSLTQSTFSLNE